MLIRVSVREKWRWLLLISGMVGLTGSPARAQSPEAKPTISSLTDSSAPGAPRTLSRVLPDSGATPTPAPVPDSTQQRAPMFPGGEAALMQFIRERLRYPTVAARNRVEGRVIMTFWVDERGHPYGFGVLKGLGAGLDEEALRILREMPEWTPALVNGRPTLLQLRIPVTFRLAE